MTRSEANWQAQSRVHEVDVGRRTGWAGWVTFAGNATSTTPADASARATSPALAIRSPSCSVSTLAVNAGAKNPVAGWLFTAAVSILVVMLLWLVVLIYVVMTPPTP